MTSKRFITQSEVIYTFYPKTLGKLKNPIIIVGMWPSWQRKGEQNFVVFEGTRSGDLIGEVTKGKDNIYITNITNYYSKAKVSPKMINEGVIELLEDLTELQPKKIICLGNYVYNFLKNIEIKSNPEIIQIKHPSYIVRFQKDRKTYIRKFRRLLK